MWRAKVKPILNPWPPPLQPGSWRQAGWLACACGLPCACPLCPPSTRGRGWTTRSRPCPRGMCLDALAQFEQYTIMVYLPAPGRNQGSAGSNQGPGQRHRGPRPLQAPPQARRSRAGGWRRAAAGSSDPAPGRRVGPSTDRSVAIEAPAVQGETGAALAQQGEERSRAWRCLAVTGPPPQLRCTVKRPCIDAHSN